MPIFQYSLVWELILRTHCSRVWLNTFIAGLCTYFGLSGDVDGYTDHYCVFAKR